jgi:hypothetical protein
MHKLATVFLILAVLGPVMPGLAQPQPKQTAGQRREKLLNEAELPFTKREENSYVTVITVDENESERFEVFLTSLSDDPNNERLQVIQMYFVVGRLTKGAAPPPALVKEMGKWHAILTLGKIVIIGEAILYTSSSWLAHTDAQLLATDAVMGHLTSKDLRKEVAPYLKQ